MNETMGCQRIGQSVQHKRTLQFRACVEPGRHCSSIAASRALTFVTHMKSPVIATALLVMLNNLSAAIPSLAPDLIIINASVRTMDADLPSAEAIAVTGNR